MKNIGLLVMALLLSAVSFGQINVSPKAFHNGVALPNIEQNTTNTDSVVVVDGEGVLQFLPKESIAPTKTSELINDGATGVSTYIESSEKAAANGVATLNGGGKIPTNQLPPVVITETFVVGSQAAMLARGATQGDVAVRTDLEKNFILQIEPSTILANWVELLSPNPPVQSVNALTGTVSLGPIFANGVLSITGSAGVTLDNRYYTKPEVDASINAKADKTTTITGTGDLTGGGDFSANRTLDLTPAAKTKLDYGETAYYRGDWNTAGLATEIWVEGQNYALTSDVPTNNNQLTNGAGYYENKGVISSPSNLNTISDGLYGWASIEPLNAPFEYGNLLQLSSSAQSVQLAFGGVEGELAIRRANSGTFAPWTEFAPKFTLGYGLSMSNDTLISGTYLDNQGTDVYRYPDNLDTPGFMFVNNTTANALNLSSNKNKGIYDQSGTFSNLSFASSQGNSSIKIGDYNQDGSRTIVDIGLSAYSAGFRVESTDYVYLGSSFAELSLQDNQGYIAADGITGGRVSVYEERARISSRLNAGSMITLDSSSPNYFINMETDSLDIVSNIFNINSNGIKTGNTNIVTGNHTIALGDSLIARSAYEVVVGAYNTDYTPISTSSWERGDRLFVVGGGLYSDGRETLRHDALIVYKGGGITAPDLSISDINEYGVKSLITAEYANATYLTVSGTPETGDVINYSAGVAKWAQPYRNSIDLISDDYTVLPNDYTLIYEGTDTSDIITLPTTSQGRMLVIVLKTRANFNVAVQTITGSIQSDLSAGYYTIQFDGTNWQLISKD